MSKKKVKVGDLVLGDGKIYIQSMLNIPAENVEESVRQAKQLEAAGCQIIRAAVPTIDDARLIPALKNAVSIPVVADIHFDYRIALAAIEAGVDKVRINPGNIGSSDRVKAVADACRLHNVPIRIGVNSGSLERRLLEKYGSPTPEALVESALGHVKLLNDCDFDDIVISIKSSDVKLMIQAYRLLAQKVDYPLHLGVTEAGTERMGLIKSAVGIGSLLCDGIGDTIRVSLTADPVREIYAARDILQACGMGTGVQIVSCPTCGRTKIALIPLAEQVEELCRSIDKPIKVAVMGCVVNGPGEAREADIGIAGGVGEGIIFKKGKILRKVPEDKLLEELKKEINLL
ncbi:MAG: flavodoxin-dependent (E)-4-hydroxy-3-methylbut-2-enyl-diphosphate synthase [Oscillospiraceae bacterium]|nr:flavodoxin-dependent (E)-4-hydroxy-3-methylbut-2-enyl-diphosphate synthase [Oscillospiraceae bacterium]